MTQIRETANIVGTISSTRQRNRPMKMSEFLSEHAVFTVDELDRFLSARGSGKPNTRKSLLTYYREQGRIIPVRRGLYATVPLGGDPASSPVDPYLVAAKMTADAIIAYHTALEFYGKAYSVYTRLSYVSARKSLPLKFQSHEFRRPPVPHPLRVKSEEMFGVTSHRRSGVGIRVTNLERTFVDMLDRPDLTGSWEEIWRSLEAVEFFDLDQVVEYVLLFENVLDDLVEIEELNRFQGPPYLFPTSGQVRPVQHVDKGSFQVGYPDSYSGTSVAGDAKHLLTFHSEGMRNGSPSEFMRLKLQRERFARGHVT